MIQAPGVLTHREYKILAYYEICPFALIYEFLLFFFSTKPRVCTLSGVYTGDKTLHVVAIASSGDLKRWENFY